MKDILYLIVVHDPKIISHFEDIGKYKVLENYKYVLVGEHIDDHSSENVIQADRFESNIEKNKNYLAYTGWWVIGKEKLSDIRENYIFFLEYDTEITDSLNIQNMEEYIYNNVEISGIASLPFDTCFFTNIHGVILRKFIVEKYKGTAKGNKQLLGKWLVSNNVVFKKPIFEKFINDSELADLLLFLNNDKMSGHDLERYISLYAILNDIKFGEINPCCFTHMALDSHDTQGRKSYYDEFKNINKISD